MTKEQIFDAIMNEDEIDIWVNNGDKMRIAKPSMAIAKWMLDQIEAGDRVEARVYYDDDGNKIPVDEYDGTNDVDTIFDSDLYNSFGRPIRVKESLGDGTEELLSIPDFFRSIGFNPGSVYSHKIAKEFTDYMLTNYRYSTIDLFGVVYHKFRRDDLNECWKIMFEGDEDPYID